MKKFLLLIIVLLGCAAPAWAAGIRGDVDGNGSVDVSDVAALVDNLLNGTAPRGNADANNDGMVDVSDLAAIVDYLLNGTWPGGDEPQGQVFTVKGVTFTMVAVEGGTFSMGATGYYDDERPVHQVNLSSYSLGQTEVTQELWLAVMGSNPSYFSSRTGSAENLQRPVECVSWDDCEAFVAELKRLTGKNFRLPTEAEWEFAARGGNKSKGYKYAGSNNIADVAWYYNNASAVGGSSPDYGTHTVATKAPNELGLYDMSGNVMEWCHDWYGYYSATVQTDPQGPNIGYDRVDRGGSWNYGDDFCRVTCRDLNGQSSGYYNIGLRLAL